MCVSLGTRATCIYLYLNLDGWLEVPITDKLLEFVQQFSNFDRKLYGRTRKLYGAPEPAA